MNEIESLERKEYALSESRNRLSQTIQSFYKKTADLSSEINEREKEKERYEAQKINRLLKDLNPKY